MLELKNKQKLAQEAHKLAASFSLVRFRSTTYIPADYETLDPQPPPMAGRTIWLPMTREQKRLMAHAQFSTLFSSDGELASFDFMVAQHAVLTAVQPTSLLVRTSHGLQQLTQDGVLENPSGDFVPNYVKPLLNDDETDMKEVYNVIEEWVDSKEEAESLLRHLATSLAPGYSAVKYVLLLGEGRNGKSLLLKMLAALFGPENVSHVTRQQISEQNPVVTELNGKLLNIIFDGQADYLKDSGTEKSLIAGELVPIRKLYESTPTIVQTNALFVEALNREPKSGDKSQALQKRLMRFQFPNVYDDDSKFEKRMLSEPMLGAFLALLIQHYVKEEDRATKLKPTGKAFDLQLDHMFTNSVVLQFLKYYDLNEAEGVNALIGLTLEELVGKFRAWRVLEGDTGSWTEPDVVNLFGTVVVTERVSKRVNGKPRKVRAVKELRPEAARFIESLKEDEDADLLEAVVDE